MKKQEPIPTEPDTEAVRDRVCEMYLAGNKLAAITEETGVPRATIFWILKKRKIATNRIGRDEDDALTLADLLAQLVQAERENERLRTELDRERIITRWFLERVILDSEMAADLTRAKQKAGRAPARPRSNSTK